MDKKGKITNTGLIVSKHPEINVESLKTGKKQCLPKKNSPKISQNCTCLAASPVTGRTAETPITDKPVLPEIITKAIAVLGSDSEYGTILATTIEAFHRATQRDASFNIITQEIAQVPSRNTRDPPTP